MRPLAAALARPADAADQRAQAGRVHERDGRHVDEELGARCQLAQGFPELPDRVSVELADGAADGVAVRLLQLDLEH